MKTIHEREMQKTTKEKQTKAERSIGTFYYLNYTLLLLHHLFITHLVIDFIITM